MLAIPKIVVFDSATLGKVSHDYCSQDASSRKKARSFVARLKHLGIVIAFTLHHVSELLRHEDEQVVRERAYRDKHQDTRLADSGWHDLQPRQPVEGAERPRQDERRA